MYIPDARGDFVLESDASDVGIGAVLRQEGRPVSYISRCLSKAEKNYSITEKEVLAALWAMEKHKYYLTGRRFTLLTDHKAIEEIKKKSCFGSARVQRWFERLEAFDFKVVYKQGESLVTSDALSRAPSNDEKEGEVNSVEKVTREKQDLKNKVLELHKKLNHRKTLSEELKKLGIKLGENSIKRIIEKCLICKKKDKEEYRTCFHVNVKNPGDRIGIDMLEINSKDRIIIAIDYFSRKLFAKPVKTKEGLKILEFVKEVYAHFPFKCIISDNGKEFKNELMCKWTKENGIQRVFSIPYYHKSNGRVERANRTIRTAIRKTYGPTNKILKDIINNYNNMRHRGTGFSPNEALKNENAEKIQSNIEKYKKEFNIKHCKSVTLMEGEKVLIKNEFKKGKMENEFEDYGIVIENEYGNIYKVRDQDGKLLRRHISQLKKV